MTQNENTKQQNGGVHIEGGEVQVGGDIVGRDKITNIRNDSLDSNAMAELAKSFAAIIQNIDKRDEDDNIDKSELKNIVKQIEEEVTKEEAANPNKVERWLKFLAMMSDDIFQVTAATLANPVYGLSKAVQLIAAKAKDEAK